MDDNLHHSSRSKSDSETLHFKPQVSKFQSFNNFPDFSYLSDTDTVQDPPTSFANQSNFSLQFNQSQTSNRNTRTNNDLRPLPRTNYCLFIPSPCSPDIYSLSLKFNRVKLLIGIESNRKRCSSKVYGNIHSNLFLVHHNLHLLDFAVKTLLFIL